MAIRPVTDTLAQLRFGELVDEMSEKLNELTTACANTGKAGAITLTIKIKPHPAGQMELTDDVTLKLPKPPRGMTLMYATPEGNLVRQDPRQMSIDGLREVDKQTGELRIPKEAASG